MPASQNTQASVWKLQVIETSRNSLLYGMALRGLPKLIDRDERSLSNFSKMLRSYFTRPLGRHPLRIAFGTEAFSVTTDAHGNFRLVSPSHPVGPIRVTDERTGETLTILQSYPVQFRLTKAPYLLVSDIDDTILVSHTRNLLARLRVLLFDAPADRRTVEATARAFRWLNTPQVQFMYLSRSEINLFHLIAGFLQHHDIPLGPIFLRNYTRWRSLFSDKDPKYKFERMDWIARAFPEKKLLLFGDDTQQDLEVFTHIARTYPYRVEAIFIRHTGGEPVDRPVARLEASGLPTLRYRSFDDLQPFLETELDAIIARH